MAVGAQHSKILEAMVVSYSVGVMELNRQRFPMPIHNAALIAFVL